MRTPEEIREELVAVAGELRDLEEQMEALRAERRILMDEYHEALEREPGELGIPVTAYVPLDRPPA